MPRIGLLLTFVVALAPASLPAAGGDRHKPSVRALKGRLSGVRDRKQALRARIRQTRTQAVAVKKTIVVVDGRLTSIRSQLAETHRDLGEARQAQTSATRQLARAASELDLARIRARARLRALGKMGDGNLLATLVQSSSVGDLASRKLQMDQIARRDHEIFARVRALKDDVARRKVERDAAVLRVARLERREREQQASLRVVREKKGVELQGLRAQERDQLADLQQFEADEAEIRRLIALANRPVRSPGHRPVPAFIGRFLKPVAAPITSGFGMRFHPILHRTRLHAGIDFGAPIGTPVRCAGPGEVVAATSMRGFGNVVIVDHGGGVSTVYGHLSRISVSEGQRIGQGQVLGAVGTTGLSTGPHLHWEVHVGGRAVDPMGRF